MRKISILPVLVFGCLIVLTSSVWAQLVDIEVVTVGDPNNTADSTGYGSVAYEYRIGKYEVTIGQYAAFLNAVAKTDTYNLYNESIMTWPATSRGISRTGNNGSYSYSVNGSGNRPVTFVGLFDAARFANWIHNGATNGASTETGAYTLNGATNGSIRKNSNAKFWIPSENEWYKAAYYKGAGTNKGYWLYPTRSDSSPDNNIGSSSNQANFWDGFFSVTQSASWDSTQDYLTDAGAFSGSKSAYGVFDQGGNVAEWNENGVIRGGRWNGPENYLRATKIEDSYAPVTGEFNAVGFRIAAAAVAASSNADLSSLSLSSGTLNPSFTTATTSYTATVGNAVSSITVTPTASQANATIQIRVNGGSFSSVTSGTASDSLNLNVGSNTVNVLVTTQDGTTTKTYTVTLTRFSTEVDTDSDGLNDAAEFAMTALGFDWQLSQPDLVSALTGNVALAGYFTEAQYEGNRLLGVIDGRAEVTNNPAAYNLYTSNSIMDLRMGGLMLQKQGSNAIVTFQPQTTTDLTQPFTNNGTPITNEISMPGNKGFIRINAKP